MKLYTQISVIHKENSGTASARNVGIELATGIFMVCGWRRPSNEGFFVCIE
jgi:glycosyltransferase involved in cell wall biosynthesis